MSLLFDSHAVIWTLINSPKLSAKVAARLRSGADTSVFVSAASLYEIEYKRGRGRMPANLPPDLRAQLLADGYDFLPIAPEHALRAARLDDRHRDPLGSPTRRSGACGKS